MAVSDGGYALAGQVRVVMLPDALIADAVSAGVLWRAFGDRILSRTKDLCPVSKSQTGGSVGGYGLGARYVQGGGLKESMEVQYVTGTDPRILIGSALQTDGNSSQNLFALVTLGTDAHQITGNPTLAFTWAGEQVFFANVQHPGTKPNPFVVKAIQQVVREAGGAAFAV